MLGWSGVCYQFYQIWDLEVQSKLMDIDGYKKVEVNKESQLFIYSFPREDCIRLDELLNSIRSEYVKIYGAQALRLIRDILLHHDKIRKEQKFHNNLTSSKVWIVFEKQSEKSDGSERFRCIFSKLNYKIHFTGYLSAPLNVNYDNHNECSSVVTDILNVLEYCQSTSHKYKQANSQMNWSKIKQQLFLSVNHKHELLDFIESIFQHYEYQNDQQRLKLLDCEQYTLKDYRGGSRFQQIVDSAIKIIFQDKLMNNMTLNDKLNLRMQTIRQEIQFWEQLPKIVQQCYNFLYNFDLKKEQKQIDPAINCLIQRINDLKSKFYGQMLIKFQNYLDQEFGKSFKMEIKLDPSLTEPHFMNLFRAEIAESLNDLDSFGSLNENWLSNEKQFEARIFEKHKPYLMEKHQELFVKEIDALIVTLL